MQYNIDNNNRMFYFSSLTWGFCYTPHTHHLKWRFVCKTEQGKTDLTGNEWNNSRTISDRNQETKGLLFQGELYSQYSQTQGFYYN